MPAARRKRLKFGNHRVTVDGIAFDSKLEAKRWGELLLLQRAGEISHLERQKSFDLVVEGELIARYVADFVYLDARGVVVEDTKSGPTAKKPDYRMKKKLLKALYGHNIVEVFK